MQKGLEQFINYPADTSNRSDCIQQASYIINYEKDNDFGMTGIDLENIDFTDDDDDSVKLESRALAIESTHHQTVPQ